MVTFQTDSYRNVMMFDSDARNMLGFMGLSDAVPSALKAEDVPAALERLKTAIEQQPKSVEPDMEYEGDNEEREPPVPLHTRALPLMELLQAAKNAKEHVIWE